MRKIPFTLHLFARNADKHWGFERERSNLTLHHPSSPFITLHFFAIFGFQLTDATYA